MLDSYIIISTYLFIGMGIGIFGVFLPLLFILHFSFKNHLDAVYFNENHFSLYELSIFKSFPLTYIKIITYIRAIVLPNTMRKRFKENILIYREHPVIYILSFISIIILSYSALVLINTVVLAIVYYSIYSPPTQ